MLKKSNVFLKVILLISISTVLLVFSIQGQVFKIKNYEDSYDKYNIVQSSGKTKVEFLEINQDIIEYLKYGNIDLMEKHFQNHEVLHMQDVYNIFRALKIGKLIGLLVLIVSLIYFKFKGELVELYDFIYRYISINYIFIGGIILLAFLDFRKYFFKFHEIFFSNDLWLLDPETDLLIQIMPEPFFFDMAIKIGLSFIATSFIIQMINLFLKKLKTKEILS